MINKPLVSVSIPTLNSERFIDKCLHAVKKQTHKNVEIILIDGFSKDRTLDIAKDIGISRILMTGGSLMRARLEGVINSNGDYILLLDSDQILEKKCIERCLDFIKEKNLDMLILEEKTLNNKSFIGKLFDLDKRLINSVRDLNPYSSVLLPRFFKRELLIKAFSKIKENVIDEATPQDHAIIYLETWKISNRVGFLENCISHIEPDDILSFTKKFFRWGYYSVNKAPTKYDVYFRKRTEKMRNGLFRNGKIIESFASILLLSMKAVPYKLGYYFAKFKKNRNGKF
jgi:glycosyltransferase involved in cell wall biosynthesis